MRKKPTGKAFRCELTLRKNPPRQFNNGFEKKGAPILRFKPRFSWGWHITCPEQERPLHDDRGMGRGIERGGCGPQAGGSGGAIITCSISAGLSRTMKWPLVITIL